MLIFQDPGPFFQVILCVDQLLNGGSRCQCAVPPVQERGVKDMAGVVYILTVSCRRRSVSLLSAREDKPIGLRGDTAPCYIGRASCDFQRRTQ